MQHRPARVGLRGGRPVQLALERRDQHVRGRFVGTSRSLRRHGAGPQLPHDFFPDFRVLGHLREVRGVEHQPGGLGPLIVAADAVAIDDGAVADGAVADGIEGCRGRRACLGRRRIRRLGHAPRSRSEPQRADDEG